MKLHLAISILLVATQTWAAGSLSTKIHNQYNSLRALGMGNAFTAVADDYSLMFYNPAGFARKPYNEIQISLLGAGVSAKTLTIAKDIKDAADTPGTDSQKAQAVSDALEKYYGESLGGKLQALELFWVRQSWGIALVPMDLTIDMSVNRQVGPSLDLNIKGDTIGAIGFGRSITSTIDAGITAKYIHRIAVDQSVSALELATNSNVLSEDRFKEGTALDFDLGFMWTPSWFGKTVVRKVEVVPEPQLEQPEKAVQTEKSTSNPEPEKQISDPAPEKAAPGSNSNTDSGNKSEEAPKETAQPGAEAAPTSPVDPKTDPSRTPQAEEQASTTDVAKPLATPADSQASDAKAIDPAPALKEANEQVPSPNAEVKNTENTPTEKPDVSVTENSQKETVTHETVEVVEKIYPLNFGLVVHNVLESGFSLSKQVNKEAIEAPAKLERVVDLGVQYKIVNMEDFKIRLLLDARNIMHPEITVQKATHMGIEFDYSPSGWFKTQLRAGMNQMYFTAGTTLLLGVLNIELATYGEEVGTPSNKMENRVTAAKVGFNF